MTDYNKQATDFLQATNTTFEIVEAIPQTKPEWAKNDKDGHKHIKYSVTLKNNKHAYTFDFWGSINDYKKVEEAKSKFSYYITNKEKAPHVIAKKEEVKPKAYDVLAGLSTCYGDTFDDFCFNFGYDEDSRSAYKVYNQVQEQERNLYKLFTHSELEQLAEIN